MTWPFDSTATHFNLPRTPWRRLVRGVLVAALVVVGLPGVVVAADSVEAAAVAPEPIRDPLEPINRVIFTFNDAVDVLLLRPAAEA